MYIELSFSFLFFIYFFFFSFFPKVLSGIGSTDGHCVTTIVKAFLGPTNRPSHGKYFANWTNFIDGPHFLAYAHSQIKLQCFPLQKK